MNLENFPTNEIAKKMMSTITGSGFYDNSYIGKWIFQVMGEEIEVAKRYIEELSEQAFPQSSTWGIGYQERKYGIPENAGITLEGRRKQIMIQKIRSPMNPAYLERQIRLIVGHDRVEVIEDNSEYVLRVEIEETDISAAAYPEVSKFVKKVKPSHLSLLIAGKYWSTFLIGLDYENDLHFISEFYPKKNLRWLCIDGTWFLNGRYTLRRYEDAEYETRIGVEAEYPVAIREENSLTIELDLWHLDGLVSLDGSRQLRAEIIRISDKDM